MKGNQLIDKGKVSMTLARLKKSGQKFEISVDPDKAIAFKKNTAKDINEVLMSEKIFVDAQKGMLASEENIKAVFNTNDVLEVAKEIILKGEIQLTSEYRNTLRDEKRKQIIDMIHRNGEDPKTGMPHPPQRIENALEEAKVKIDEHKKAEDQIKDIIKQIQTVLPIHLETKTIQVIIPSEFAGKAYPSLKSFGKLVKDEWQNDGSLLAIIEIPAGLTEELLSQLNNLTHGNIETKIIER